MPLTDLSDFSAENAEALCRLVLRQTVVGVCVLDRDGRVLHANPACCRLSGRAEEDFKGRHWTEFTYPDDVAAERSLIAALKSGERHSYTIQKRFLTPLGEPVWTETTVSPLQVPAGAPAAFVAIVVDTQDSHRTEQAWREVQNQLSRILENVPDGLARVSRDGVVLYVNHAILRILGLQDVDVNGLLLGNLPLPPEDLEQWWQTIQGVLESGKPGELELQWQGRYFNWRVIPEPGQNSVLSVSRDITAAVRSRQEKLERLKRAETLNALGVAVGEAGMDLEAVLDRIAEFCASSIGGLCLLTRLSADGQAMVAEAVYHPDPELRTLGCELMRRSPFRTDGRIFSQLLSTRSAFRMETVPDGFIRRVLRPEHQPFASRCEVHSLLIAPMRGHRAVVGAITLARTEPDSPYTAEDEALLQELADRAALTLANVDLYVKNQQQAEQLKRVNAELEQRVAERTRELAEANELLQKLATHDALTGLANRRHFDDVLERELRRARRENRWVSLLMLDIDHFKRFNDYYGHVRGDECLQRVARVLQECFRRGGDVPARYGGEEFAVILPDLDLTQSLARAERLREAIVAENIEHRASPLHTCVTVSIGIASVPPGEECGPETVIARADAALYRSKADGRNRVSGPPTVSEALPAGEVPGDQQPQRHAQR